MEILTDSDESEEDEPKTAEQTAAK